MCVYVGRGWCELVDKICLSDCRLSREHKIDKLFNIVFSSCCRNPDASGDCLWCSIWTFSCCKCNFVCLLHVSSVLSNFKSCQNSSSVAKAVIHSRYETNVTKIFQEVNLLSWWLLLNNY